MTESFQSTYTNCYDLLYHDKDYAGEAGFVAALLDRYGPSSRDGVSLLDMACGTGRHMVEFARRGLQVSGSDRSSAMLRRAEANLAAAGVRADLHCHSFQTASEIRRTFTVVTAMFSAVNYLTTYRDLSQALEGIGKLLNPGGLFVFDFWNGIAVLEGYSPVRIKEVYQGTRRIIRTSETTLEQVRQTARVHYHVLVLEGSQIVADFSEDHDLRYYFPQEMVDFLTIHGFDVLHRCPFMQADKEIHALDWNLSFVARKRG